MMENITEMEVHNQENTLDLIRTANLRRQVKKTKSNDSSSRSHAIISLKLEIHKKYGCDCLRLQNFLCARYLIEILFLFSGESRFSTFKIVDLAGSEAVAKDGVMGEIKNEGIFINKGRLKFEN